MGLEEFNKEMDEWYARKPNHFKEVCSNCGIPRGSHHAGTSPWPYEYCPGSEHRMDWENGPGTTFKGSGDYKED